MPHVCQCVGGICTVPLITSFNFWLVLKWSGSWTRCDHCQSLPSGIVCFILTLRVYHRVCHSWCSSSKQNFSRTLSCLILRESKIYSYLQDLSSAMLLKQIRIIGVHRVICMASWVVSCTAFGTWVLIWGHELKLAVLDDDHADLGVNGGPFIIMAGDRHLPHTCFSISWKLSIFLCNISI